MDDLPLISAGEFEFTGRNQPYARLGEALDELPAQVLVVDDAERKSVADKRTAIARTYLFLLGFLESDNSNAAVDSAFTAALREFQQQAGFEPAGQLSAQSWQGLIQLAAFDTSTKIDYWLQTDTRLAVLKRAVQLRLFSFGLVTSAPRPATTHANKQKLRDRELQEGLNQFVRAVALLGLAEADLEPDFSATTLTCLFDQESLVTGLTPEGNRFRIFKQHHFFPCPDKDNARLLKQFISNLAITELWLLGYAVRPGNFKAEGAAGRDQDGSLYSAIRDFCRDHDLESMFRHKQDITLGYWLFEEIKKAHTVAVSAEEELLDDAIINQIAADKNQLAMLGSTYQSLGARLIDGVQRAFMWLAGLIRRIFNAVKQMLCNLARLLHAGAVRVYRRLKSVLFALRDGLEYLFANPIAGSDPEQLYMMHASDFDLDILINRHADNNYIRAYSRQVLLRARVFSLACRIFAGLLELVKLILQGTGAALGWLGLLLALVKLGNWIKNAIRISRETEALMLQIDSREYLVMKVY
ncbi:MAG: hypothetical protein HW386_1375 [Gammaproteobacteria bacterium]|nr:hypothetical protein [Gammaproteobacteria bacterium]